MIDMDNVRKTIVMGLQNYLKVQVIRSNQSKKPPSFPYVSYTITSPIIDNEGTWGTYEDGIDRKPFTQVWSLTAQSKDDVEALSLCLKAYAWLDRIGCVYLEDNGIIIQNLSDIANRDNLISINYEYRKGFDMTIGLMAEVNSPNDTIGYIESADITRK